MTRDVLVALGACLVLMGFVMRGLARSGRRDQALRKQHRLDHPDDPESSDAVTRWLENNLGRLAGGTILLGFLVIIAGFWRG